AVVLRVLRREIRRRAVFAGAAAQRRVLAAQPRHRSFVRRVQRDSVSQRAHLFRPDSPDARARTLLRVARALGHSLSRVEGDAATVGIRGVVRGVVGRRPDLPEGSVDVYEIIVIGTSWGGLS